MKSNKSFAQQMLEVITQCTKQGCTEEETKQHMQEAMQEYRKQQTPKQGENVPLYSDMMKKQTKG